MTKWIPGLLLAAALSLHSAVAKESRGSATTSATKSSSTNNTSSSSSSSTSRTTHSRFTQDDAREALKRGKVMPLTAILEIAARREPGTVIAVDLETEKGRLIYEIDVITEDGRRRELKIDARKGEILSVEDE